MNKNITLVIDEDELKSAQMFASKQGASIKQLVHEYIRLVFEDLNYGRLYGSIRVCNPFKEDFLAFQ